MGDEYEALGPLGAAPIFPSPAVLPSPAIPSILREAEETEIQSTSSLLTECLGSIFSQTQSNGEIS
ncbi:hypothetical protein X798_07835 [Onchocerca flexuosa]|uniref:Uncharacterized protein n=1 Tax=Onchocerca flexuosa TaxID=387005 RepID=A0A238BK21_9BILA|nr:hypothetical protein X798_07835 [Onchocerca flexuosa]